MSKKVSEVLANLNSFLVDAIHLAEPLTPQGVAKVKAHIAAVKNLSDREVGEHAVAYKRGVANGKGVPAERKRLIIGFIDSISPADVIAMGAHTKRFMVSHVETALKTPRVMVRLKAL